MRPDDGAVLEVDPQGVRAVAAGLRQRSVVVAAQRQVCDGVHVVGGDLSIGPRLGSFASMWGSAVSALAHELDLLGVELAKSAGAVVAADRAGVR